MERQGNRTRRRRSVFLSIRFLRLGLRPWLGSPRPKPTYSFYPWEAGKLRNKFIEVVPAAGAKPFRRPAIPEDICLLFVDWALEHYSRWCSNNGLQALPGAKPEAYDGCCPVRWPPGGAAEVRQMQQLERVPEERKMVGRFIVRGHWRRPARGGRPAHPLDTSSLKRAGYGTAIERRTYKLKP